jgi:hypothetical protein
MKTILSAEAESSKLATTRPTAPAAAGGNGDGRAQQATGHVNGDDQAVRFLETIFAPGDTILIRPVESWTERDKKQSRTDYAGTRYQLNGLRNGDGWHPFPQILANAVRRVAERSEREKTNSFFGVCPRVGRDGRFDQAWQIRTVHTLWADLDDCTADQALERIEAAGLPLPSIVVASGHGVHVYWLLDTPYLIDDAPTPEPVETEFIDQGDGKKKKRRLYVLDRESKEKRYLDIPANRPALSPKAQHLQDVLAGIAAKIGGDHTTDLSRLLRLPGTLNRKDQRNGREPIPCTLITCDPSRRYPIDVFRAYAEKSPAKIEREKISKVQLPPVKKLSGKRADRLPDKINGCVVAGAGQRSEVDFALCCFAIEQGIDREEVWQQVSGIGKFAEAGQRYFDRTWSKAEQHTRERIYHKASGKATDKRKTKTAQADSGKPTIIIDVDEKRVIDEAIAALVNCENVYQRVGFLVQVVEGGDSPKGIDRPKSAPHIGPIKPARIRELLAGAADWIKPPTGDGDGDSELCHPPDWTVRAVDARGQWPGIRQLTAVVETPILRADGSILSQPGYDQATGIILQADAPFNPPARPTRDDAIAAVNVLCETVQDFPFSKPEHRAAWLVGTITPAARYAFHGAAPLTLIDANVPGCGKSLLTDVTALIISARDMARMSLPRDDDEFRKRITALAMAAEPLILIDNISGTLGSPSLDAALTATTWSDRILGETAMASGLPLYATWYATGNNVILGADTSRRTLHIRLESDQERPEERTDFHHHNLLGWVRENRPRLATAAVTILAAYSTAGRPDQGLTPWGSFEGWSDLVRSAIVWAGQPDPAVTRTELTSQADRETTALRQLLLGWSEVDGAGVGYTVAEMVRELAEHPHAYEAVRGALWELCPPKDGKTFNPRSIGAKFHHLRHRVLGGRYLTRRETKVGAVWTVRESATVVGGNGGSGGSNSGTPREKKKNEGESEKMQNPTVAENTATITTVTPCLHANVVKTPTFDGYVNRQCRDCGADLPCEPIPPSWKN